MLFLTAEFVKTWMKVNGQVKCGYFALFILPYMRSNSSVLDLTNRAHRQKLMENRSVTMIS